MYARLLSRVLPVLVCCLSGVGSLRANILIINDTLCTTWARWGYLTGGCPWNGSSQPNYIANLSFASGAQLNHTDDTPGYAVVYGKWCNTHNTWEYGCFTSPGTYLLSSIGTHLCQNVTNIDYCVDWSVQNLDIQPRQYVGCKDGNPVDIGPWLQPGERWTWHRCYTNPWSATVLRMQPGTDGSDLTLYPTMSTNCNTTATPGSGGTNTFSATGSGEYWNGSQTNINWGINGGTNDTRTGFSALLDALTRLNSIVGQTNFIGGGGGGSGAVSNYVGVSNYVAVTLTNTHDWASNLFNMATNLAAWRTNSDGLAEGSNAWASIQGTIEALTNVVAGIPEFGSNTIAFEYDIPDMHLGPGGKGAKGLGTISARIPTGLKIKLDPNRVELSSMVWVWRGCFLAITIMLFTKVYGLFERNAMVLVRVPQARSAGTTVLGNSISAASALTMAVAIVAGIALLIAMGVGLLAPISLAVGSAFGNVSGLGSALPFAFGLLNKMFPVDYALASWGVYWVFRITSGALTLAIAAFIKMAVGV